MVTLTAAVLQQAFNLATANFFDLWELRGLTRAYKRGDKAPPDGRNTKSRLCVGSPGHRWLLRVLFLCFICRSSASGS